MSSKSIGQKDLFILDTIQNNRELSQIYNAIKTYINNYDMRTAANKDPCLIAALVGMAQYALQDKNYLKERISFKYPIKVSGNITDVICIFNKDKYKPPKVVVKEISEDIITALSFDVSGLPKITEILASGVILTKESVDLRLSWMNNVEGFKTEFGDVVIQADTSELQMSRLINFHVKSRRIKYEEAWQKIIRCFLTGLTMDNFYKEKMSKTKTKVTKKSKIKQSEYNEHTMEVISNSCKFLQNENIVNMFCKTLMDKFNFTTSISNYNYNEAKKLLIKDIKIDIKISYLLYHFVKKFGFIALVCPTMATEEYLLRMLCFTDLEDITYKFEVIMKRGEFGHSIINANTNFGKQIGLAVVEYSKKIKIYNEIMEKQLSALSTNYEFKTYYDQYKLSDRNNTYRESNLSQINVKRPKIVVNMHNQSGSNKDDEIIRLRRALDYQKDKNKAVSSGVRSEVNQITENVFGSPSIANIMNSDPTQTYNNKKRGFQQNVDEMDQNYQASEDSLTTEQINALEASTTLSIQNLQNEHNLAVNNQSNYSVPNFNFAGKVDLQEDERARLMKSIEIVESALSKEAIDHFRQVSINSIDPSLNRFNEEDKNIISYQNVLFDLNANQNFTIYGDDQLSSMKEVVDSFILGLTPENRQLFDSQVNEVAQNVTDESVIIRPLEHRSLLIQSELINEVMNQQQSNIV